MSQKSPNQYPTVSTVVLKAMSHPLRRSILSTLRIGGPARAADLASKLDEPANRLSFHLRVLADAGLIEEAPDLARDKRDRVWRSVPHPYSLGSPESPVPDRELGMAVLGGILADHQRLLSRVATYAEDYSTGADTELRGTLNDHIVRTTRPRFEEMIQRLDEVIDEYRDDAKDLPQEDLLGWEILIAVASEEI